MAGGSAWHFRGSISYAHDYGRAWHSALQVEIAESSVAEEEKESSKSRPGNNAKEGDDTDGEEQAQTSPEMTEHQTKAHTEEPVTIQAEDHNLEEQHKEEVT